MYCLYFRSLLCIMYCIIYSCKNLKHRSTSYHTLSVHIDQGRWLGLGKFPEHKRKWDKKKNEMYVARRDQGILRRAVNRYTARLHRRLKRLFLDTQGYLHAIYCNSKSQWRLLDEKQDCRKGAIREVHRGQNDLWTLITMSITILAVPIHTDLTETSFSDSEGNTCDSVITPVLAHILVGI